jgi:hypothetical protein
MNGLHDLLATLKKLEEAAVAPTQFKANYFHKNNFGGRTDLMMTDPGVFWHMASATNDEGGAVRGGGKTIQQWYGYTENRSAINPASVDGKIVDGKYYEFPEGTTWKTDLASLAQTNQSVAATNASLAQADADMAKYRANFAKDPLGANGAKLPNTLSVQPAVAAPAVAAPAVAAPAVAAPAQPVVTGEVGLNQFRDLVKKGMAKLGGTAESIQFKSSIGRALLESFDLKLNERITPAEMASGLTTAEIALGDKLSQSYGDSEDPEIQDLLTKWSQIKNNMIQSKPLAQTQADVVSTITTPPAPAATSSPAQVKASDNEIAANNSAEPAPAKVTASAKVPSPEVVKLATDNGIKDPNAIKPGQKITMPPPDSRTYTVVPGDNLTDILAGKGKGTYEKPESSQQKTPPKNVTQVSPDAQNMAGTKSTLKPDEIKAAQEALKDPSISARDKAYYTELLKNQPSATTGDIADQARPGLDPKKGKPEVYDRQKQLAALGAKMKDGVTPLGTDGVRGNDTIAAEKQFGSMIIDPKTTIIVNGTSRAVNPADIKSIQSWIKAVTEKRKKMEEVPPVYMDIVKKQLAIKESTGFTNDELNRIVSLVHHR